MKRTLIGLVLAASSLSALAGTPVDVGFNIMIGNAPPPPRVEVVPVARPGMVWMPGFWGWDGRRHVWYEGHWEAVRPGYVYQAPVWVQARNGWMLREGGWHPERRERAERREREERHEREERREWEGRDHPHGCPPGQAKKGNC